MESSEFSWLFLFSFVREIELIIVRSFYSRHFLYKQILHVGILQQKQWCGRLQPHFFSGVKLSKEVCVHHIEHEPFLQTVEEIYFCMIAHQIHQLLHMQGSSFYFHVSILDMYPFEQWFYQNDLDTTTLIFFSHVD